jgi:hypothetical protein
MRLKKDIVFILVFLGALRFSTSGQESLDKASFFASLQSGDMDGINQQIKVVQASSIKEKDAYYGALLMRKAGLVKGAPNKLSLFKSGHNKLESSIKKNNSSVELHFLRLMVQENAPRILGYQTDEQQDADFIKKNYKDLPKVIQQAISDYSRQSKILKPADFNFTKDE